jgi:hypothetical protein
MASGLWFMKRGINVENVSPLDITFKVHTGEYPVLNHKNYNVEEEYEKVEKTADPLREFKDFSTEIVVNHFLSSDTCMFNFLDLVYGTYFKVIEKFKRLNNLSKWDIFLVYKGGNVLRIIANDFLNELPRVASTKINNYYQKFFKRSDADFSVYIKPTVPNYDELYTKLSTISYYLQVKLRQEFEKDPGRYFEFYKYNKKEQDRIIELCYQKAQTLNSLTDINNTVFYNKRCEGIMLGEAHSYTISKTYEGHKDYGLQFKKDTQIARFKLDNKDREMFIQVNETLDFPAGKNRTKFNLVRTKIGFNYVINGEIMKIGGELIDVSLPHRTDSNIKHFFDSTYYINQYQLTLEDRVLQFYSYSLRYMVSDLEYILFEFVDLPWKTPKYEKRLNRLFYLYFIDMFLVIKENSERKYIIETMKERIFNKTITLTGDSKKDIEQDLLPSLEKLIRGPKRANIRLVEGDNKKEKSKIMFYSLLLRLRTILERLKDSRDPADIVNYNNMVEVLSDNCEFVSTAFRGIEEYCTSEGKINMKVLYRNKFSSLI